MLNSEGHRLFLERLKAIGWSSLNNGDMAKQLGIDRSIVPNLISGTHQGHKSKLQNILRAVGLDAEDVQSETFAKKYFQEVNNSSKQTSVLEFPTNVIESVVGLEQALVFENPFLPLNGRVENSEYFFNREKELRDIFDFLNSGSGVELLGDRQIGKSSVLMQIKQRAAAVLRDKWEPIYLNLQKVHTEADFYESFCEELGVASCTGNDLNRLMRSRRVLLLLDETENLTSNGFTREIRDRLRAFAEDGSLRLVVAACTPLDHLFPDSDEKGMTSPFHGICLRVDLKPWNEVTVRKFVAARLEPTRICFIEADMEKLWQESQGHPQKLMKACFDLYRQYCPNV